MVWEAWEVAWVFKFNVGHIELANGQKGGGGRKQSYKNLLIQKYLNLPNWPPTENKWDLISVYPVSSHGFLYVSNWKSQIIKASHPSTPGSSGLLDQ